MTDRPNESGGGPVTSERLLARLREELRPDLEVLRLLGEGQAARVFLARDEALGRLVALKVPRETRISDPVAARRFEREARSVASLSHPNVVDVYRYGRLADGAPYLVMHYVEGRSAEERLVAEGPMEPGRVREVLASVASALAAAHRRGIVHRDVRPGNILLEEETDRVFLTDFGIAALLPEAQDPSAEKLTREGEKLSLPAYASPEQLRGDEVAVASDIYSLGVTGYRLLSGRLPYDASSDGDLVLAHLTAEPRPLPDADPVLGDVLRRSLSKSPDRRPKAGWIASRLAGSADGTSRRASTAAGELFQRVRRRRLVQIVVAYLAVGATVIGVSADLTGVVFSSDGFRATLVTVVAGFLYALILGWYHGERGVQRIQPLELLLLVAVGVAWLTAMVGVLLG